MAKKNQGNVDECSNSFIPIIDISMFDESTSAEAMAMTAEKVRQVCMNSGFFFLEPPTNVQQLMAKLMDAVRHFFTLPLHEKQKLNNDETTWFRVGKTKIPGTGPGYRGFGSDPNFKQDSRESYNFGDDSVLHNKWPAVDKFPVEQIMYFKEYARSLLDTSVILRRLVALALRQDMEIFDRPGYFDVPFWLLGMVHYSRELSDPEAGLYSIRPHCDSGMFTLLVTDGQPGLQICPDKSKPPESREWIDVSPAPQGHFTVNLGKILERLSNGIFTATMHRVVNKTGNERFSSPFFYDTNIDTVLAPFPECCIDIPAQYSPTTPAKLSLQRLNATNKQFE